VDVRVLGRRVPESRRGEGIMIFNPMAWPLAAKIGGILGVAVLGGVTATAAISSSGTPGEPGVATYLCQASTNDILLQWRSDGGDLSGTYERVQLSGPAPGRAGQPGLR
jgi:hypothetical protein